MSDLSPDMMDMAKVGGGGAFASALTIIAGRLFGSQDKVLARLDVLQATVSELSQKLAVLVATSRQRDSDVDGIKAQVADHTKQMASLAVDVAKLSAVLAQLSEGK